MKKVTPEISEKIFDLRKAGWNYIEIQRYIKVGYKMDVSITTISNDLVNRLHEEQYGKV